MLQHMAKRPIRAEDLLRIVYLGDPQISPDGDRVVYVRKHIGERNNYVTNLSMVDLEGNVTPWTQGQKGASHPRWSPDGSQIAFISGREEPASQIFLVPTAGGEARKLSNLPEGTIGGFRWAPDGKRIAFTFRETPEDRTTKARKEREEKGLSTPPWEIDDVWYRLDGDGYFGNQRHKLCVLDVATGEHRVLYEGAVLGTYHFDWSPDGTELAVVHSASRKPLADPANDQIYRVDLQGQAWQLNGLPKGDKGPIRWSPDGRWLAYAGDVDENDPWGVRNTKIYLVAAEGGEPRCLTGDTDYDAAVATLSDARDPGFDATLEWAPDSQSLFVQIGWHGESQLGRVSLNGGIALLTEGHQAVGVGSVSRSGLRVAATVGDPLHLPEIAVIEPELGTGRMVPKILTTENAAFHEEIRLSKPEEVWIESTDGVQVHAWVIKPIDYLEPRRYPAVLEIHGGPHTQYGWVFFHEFQLLAAQGYVVVYSNPRGSKGYGEAHTAAIRGDWGNKDWDDIQAVTRWMQHQTYIHPGRMGVMGGSYGGYMTNWVIGHTHDFRAAITDRCVSNMVSMAGSSDFPFNKNGYFHGVAWGDHESIKELWRQSPIAYFEEVKTPTLVIHSEGDLRCNVEQGEQVFTALQQQGIESRFVRYPSNSSHGLSRSGPPDLRLHRLKEILVWWERHLG
jgi:dipeptidyl aminopeptidase/acylaminoacyl peptidase